MKEKKRANRKERSKEAAETEDNSEKEKTDGSMSSQDALAGGAAVSAGATQQRDGLTGESDSFDATAGDGAVEGQQLDEGEEESSELGPETEHLPE